MFNKFLDHGGGIVLVFGVGAIIFCAIVIACSYVENIIEDGRARRCVEMNYCPYYEPNDGKERGEK